MPPPTMTSPSSSTTAKFPPHSSICALISFLHTHLRALLADPPALLATRRRCAALLAPPLSASTSEEDAAVLAALHGAMDSLPHGEAWGVEGALQAPALLPEEGETGGVENRRVAACAYFCLALVQQRADAWQTAVHFFQAVLVSPAAAAQLAPRELWAGLFDDKSPDAARGAARKYKDWLMYYRVVASSAAPDVAGYVRVSRYRGGKLN